MLIFCVRHGETEWNQLKLVQGSSDIPLTIEGKLQAEKFAISSPFKELTFKAVYSSDLVRASETAEILCGAEADGVKPVLVKDLRERFLGEFEGKPLKDMIAKIGPWESLPPDQQWTTSVAKSETFQSVYDRVALFIKSLVEVHDDDDNILLVSHSDVLRALYLQITKEHPLHRLVGYSNLGYIILSYDSESSELKVMESQGQIRLRPLTSGLEMDRVRHENLMSLYQAKGKKDLGEFKTELDILRENYRFLLDEEGEGSAEAGGEGWELRLVRKYHDQLYKECCLADLSRVTQPGNQIGLRWRTEKEVIEGKGQFICGSLSCNAEEEEELVSWEVPFRYQEQGESKVALVKLRLCKACSTLFPSSKSNAR